MMIWYMMVWYMMMIRKYPWWREMHGHCTTRWVETKRFLKRCSAVCWSSDVKSQSDKFGFCRPLFREAPVHSWFHHHPLCWMSSLSLYTFLGFPMFSPNFLRTLPALLSPPSRSTSGGAGAASDWKLSFSEHGRHEALVYRRRYLFSSGTTKMLGGSPSMLGKWWKKKTKQKFAVEIFLGIWLYRLYKWLGYV